MIWPDSGWCCPRFTFLASGASRGTDSDATYVVADAVRRSLGRSPERLGCGLVPILFSEPKHNCDIWYIDISYTTNNIIIYIYRGVTENEGVPTLVALPPFSDKSMSWLYSGFFVEIVESIWQFSSRADLPFLVTAIHIVSERKCTRLRWIKRFLFEVPPCLLFLSNDFDT